VASEIGQYDVEMTQLSGHDVQPCGDLLALSLECRSLAKLFILDWTGGPGAKPVDVRQPAVESVEFGG
jgi:hypothetical protein